MTNDVLEWKIENLVLPTFLVLSIPIEWDPTQSVEIKALQESGNPIQIQLFDILRQESELAYDQILVSKQVDYGIEDNLNLNLQVFLFPIWMEQKSQFQLSK